MREETQSVAFPITLGQSMVCLSLRMVFLQILFAFVYFPFIFIPHFLPFTQEIKLFAYSFSTAAFVPLVLIQIYFVTHLILRWFTQSYVIRPGEILFRSGIFSRKEKIYLLKHIESVTCNQNILERVCKYGTIQLYNPILRKYIHVDAVNNPRKYVRVIEEAARIDSTMQIQDMLKESPEEFTQGLTLELESLIKNLNL